MKAWIMMIFRVQRLLGAACDALDKRAKNVALDAFGDTFENAATLLEINERKRRLVNLAVLGHRLTCGLGERASLLEATADGATVADIAAYEGVSRTTAFRRLQTAFKKAQTILSRLGFDFKRMESEYADIPLIKKVYAACERRCRTESAA